MPALPNVPNVLRHDLSFAYGGFQPLVTRLFFQYTGTPPTNAQLNTYCTAALANAATQFVPLLDVNASVNGLFVTDLTTTSSGAGSAFGTSTGTRTGNPVPAQSCVLLNNHIGRRYRGGKPRQYFPFGVSGDLANPQNWSASFQSTCLTAINAWITFLRGNPPAGTALPNQVNVSYYQGFESVQNPITGRWRNIAKPRTAPLIDIVNTVTVNPKVASQRRRISA